MRRFPFVSVLLALTIVNAGCGRASLGRPAPEILKSRDAIRNAVLRGDAESTAAFFTTDAVITPPDADEVRGRAAIRVLFDGVFKQVRITRYDISPDSIVLAGPAVAVERGTYIENVVPAQGSATLLNGRYVFFWERGADGQWRAARLLYNHAPPKK